MVHAYALHVDVEAACLCCRSPQTFRFSSSSDQVVCLHCIHHLGSGKAERRDLEHVKLWSDLHGELREALADTVRGASEYQESSSSKIVELESTVSGLVNGVADRFAAESAKKSAGESAKVVPLIESAIVGRAERTVELTNRRTDRVLATLWSIDDLHHDDPAKAGMCTCGRRMAACPEWTLIEPQRQALREWEKKNLGLLSAGERHALPSSHPAVRAESSPADQRAADGRRGDRRR